MNFVAIVGTNALKSYNRNLLWFMKKHFKQQANIEIIEIADLPMFSEDAQVPVRIVEIAHQIKAADGVIISTPEYDHSITASLKSFIEWMSYVEMHPFANMPVMLVGASLGRQGTNNAQEHLRQIMDAPGLDALVLPGNQFLVGPAAENINIEREELTNQQTISFLDTIFQHFIIFTKLLEPMLTMNVDRATAKQSNTNMQVPVKLGYTSLTNVLNGSPFDDDVLPEIIKPAPTTEITEKGDGWWVEKITLSNQASCVAPQVVSQPVITQVATDATTGASMF